MNMALGGLFGLFGLALVLSISDDTWILLPLANGMGVRKLYDRCQLKS